MKKKTFKLLSLIAISVAISNPSIAQQWTGPSTTPGPITTATGVTDVNVPNNLNVGTSTTPASVNCYGTLYGADFHASNNGYVVNTMNVGTSTNPGVINCTGTTYTVDMHTNGNGYVTNTLNVGTSTSPGVINCTGTTNTWDVNANGNGYINGYLRIGNTVSLPSGYKLYVGEGILTEKLKVAVANTTHWSDYVFADNYELTSLNEVEKFISKNKHLPGVPSAEQVVKEGIDVATMDAKLLQKIEELTLYVIQQQKEIEKLKKQIKK